jgi:hypothetical protein
VQLGRLSTTELYPYPQLFLIFIHKMGRDSGRKQLMSIHLLCSHLCSSRIMEKRMGLFGKVGSANFMMSPLGDP